jgi:hypothetical protein
MQFSLFGAEAAEPLVQDLDGVLFAGGDWVRADGGSAARLSVLVAERWRAEALRAEFADRDLASDTAVAPGDLIAVRTEITPRLGPYALRWTRGAALRPPADLELTASALRLWAIAAGHTEDAGFLLRMADPDGPLHRMAGAQLARLGVTAVEVAGRGGTGWRITSLKRLRRLAELIGAPPAGCGADWPLGSSPE